VLFNFDNKSQEYRVPGFDKNLINSAIYNSKDVITMSQFSRPYQTGEKRGISSFNFGLKAAGDKIIN